MNRIFAIVGGILVALGAIAGVIIYLQKRGIINICCCDDCDFDDFQQDKQPEENETKL